MGFMRLSFDGGGGCGLPPRGKVLVQNRDRAVTTHPQVRVQDFDGWNTTPEGNTAAINAAIRHGVRTGATTVHIPPGIYRLAEWPSEAASREFPLTLAAEDGVTLILPQGATVNARAGINLFGLHIDFLGPSGNYIRNISILNTDKGVDLASLLRG
jgi:hypothetical protein